MTAPIQFDDDLIVRAVGGDADALTALLGRHGPDVSRGLQISRKWQGVVEPDDVMQVTYLEAFLRISEFSPGGSGSFVAWLNRIAQNNLRDAIREMERAKRPQPDKRVMAPDDRSYVELVQLLAASGGTPSGAAAANEAAQAVEGALTRLPPDYEKVIRMYELQGRSIQEVATEMGRSQGAVKMLLCRGRDLLREKIGSATRFFSGGA